MVSLCPSLAGRVLKLTGQPEYPYNARMYTQQERELAVWRLEREAGSAEGKEDIGTWEGFKIGMRDPKLYALIFCNMMSQFQGSIANFFPVSLRSALSRTRRIIEIGREMKEISTFETFPHSATLLTATDYRQDSRLRQFDHATSHCAPLRLGWWLVHVADLVFGRELNKSFIYLFIFFFFFFFSELTPSAEEHYVPPDHRLHLPLLRDLHSAHGHREYWR